MDRPIDRFSWRKDAQIGEYDRLRLVDSSQGPLKGGYIHSFLSNFYPSRVKWEGLVYPTVEHAFQAAKTVQPGERHWFTLESPPGPTKARGRRLDLRPDWEDVKLAVMGLLVVQKFMVHEPLRVALLATGQAELIEGNDWGDTFWGAVRSDDGGWRGENELGKILMGTREVLRRAAG